MLESIPDVPFFQGLEDENLSLLKPLFENFSCPPGTVVFEQGEPATYLYLILHGTMAIHFKPYDGPAITITHLHAGALFGWSAVVGSPVYSSSLICKTQLTALRINGESLRKLCIQHPDTGRVVLDRLARLVSNRWKDARTQVKSMLDKSLPLENQEKNKVQKP